MLAGNSSLSGPQAEATLSLVGRKGPKGLSPETAPFRVSPPTHLVSEHQLLHVLCLSMFCTTLADTALSVTCTRLQATAASLAPKRKPPLVSLAARDPKA
jgi:hypothetical protein